MCGGGGGAPGGGGQVDIIQGWTFTHCFEAPAFDVCNRNSLASPAVVCVMIARRHHMSARIFHILFSQISHIFASMPSIHRICLYTYYVCEISKHNSTY